MRPQSFATKFGTAVLAIASLAVNVLIFIYAGLPFGTWAVSWMPEGFIRTLVWLIAICVPVYISFPVTEYLFRKATREDQDP